MEQAVMIMVDSLPHQTIAGTAAQAGRELSSRKLLAAAGFDVACTDLAQYARTGLPRPSFVVLHMPIQTAMTCLTDSSPLPEAPIFWWSDGNTAILKTEIAELDRLDGILSARMLPQELRWTIRIAMTRRNEKKQWLAEREKLLERLNERKWIDMAKGILCKMKNISENEAYELLRKQAMNERKRIVDIAVSIINVYQLLQDQK